MLSILTIISDSLTLCMGAAFAFWNKSIYSKHEQIYSKHMNIFSENIV